MSRRGRRGRRGRGRGILVPVPVPVGVSGEKCSGGLEDDKAYSALALEVIRIELDF
jgi:hypothetical protein